MCTPSDPALHTSMTIYTCEVCGKMTNLGTKIETDDGLFFADQLPSGWWQVERYDSESDAMNKYACDQTCAMEFVRKQKKDHDDRVSRRMQSEANDAAPSE